MIRWTGLAPRQFDFPFRGSLTSTFLAEDLTRQFTGNLLMQGLFLDEQMQTEESPEGGLSSYSSHSESSAPNSYTSLTLDPQLRVARPVVQ